MFLNQIVCMNTYFPYSSAERSIIPIQELYARHRRRSRGDGGTRSPNSLVGGQYRHCLSNNREKVLSRGHCPPNVEH